jgi:hypothetical protein
MLRRVDVVVAECGKFHEPGREKVQGRFQLYEVELYIRERLGCR